MTEFICLWVPRVWWGLVAFGVASAVTSYAWGVALLIVGRE